MTTKISALLALAAFAAPAAAQQLTVEQVATGLISPVKVTHAPGDSSRLFVVEQGGRIRIIEDGTLLTAPFLNISSDVTSGGESGLLGLAFHPDYQTNGRFFVNYTQDSNGGPLGSGDTVIAEYAVSANPDVANPTQVQVIIAINQPFSNHNAGDLAFGPDGKLYIPMGDGGSGNDPGNRAQTITNNLGKLLRLDVDIASPFIPADNPFVGTAGNDEIWAFGLRNPWRFSFDRLTGDMWIGDVGQNAIEEVNFAPVTSTGGENYGWRCMEGNSCTGLSGCTCNGTNLTDPIWDYSQAGGNCSVIGGYVYRGDDIPGLQGTYFFADFCSSNIWSLVEVGGSATQFTNRTAELSGPIGLISAFGEDADGELYIVAIAGQVYKIVEECGYDNYCVAEPNSTGQPASIAGSGSLEISDEELSLVASDVPPNRFGYFLMSQTQGFIPLFAGSQGNFCLGAPFIRFAADGMLSSPSGKLTLLPDYDNLPNGAVFSAGDTWNFQAWFRDVNPTATSNTTNGLTVQFCP